jgi:hypothetical protein
MYFDSSLGWTSWDEEEIRHEVKESPGGVDPSPFRREDSVEDEGVGRRLARVDRERTPGQVAVVDLSHLRRARPNSGSSILTLEAWCDFLRQHHYRRQV